MSASPTRIFVNASVFTASPPYLGRPHADAFVVRDGRIAYAGDLVTARRIAGSDAELVDLGGALVLPGIVDAHVHVLHTGDVLGQADLQGIVDRDEVERRITAWAQAHPEARSIAPNGLLPVTVPTDRRERDWLDGLVSDRPLLVSTSDLHSIYLNTKALEMLGIDRHTQAPAGGAIRRDADGEPTGYVDETALQQLVWPVLAARAGEEDHDRHLAVALEAFRRHGITTVVEMGLEEHDLAAMRRAEARGELTTRIVAHWVLSPMGDADSRLAQVDRAIELAGEQNSDRLRITGIKVMIDGTVDGCTAALGKPYANGARPGPIWTDEMLAPVVAKADAAGLQVAMHAIGDEAVRGAISAVEHAIRVNGPRDRRHRIEHLEVVDKADLERLAALGISASMQPVHADPAIGDNWSTMLGDERVDRGFPWTEVTGSGARLVFGTDTPTAPLHPLHNLYIAATRKSVLDPSRPAYLEQYAVPLAEGIVHATYDAAWLCRGEGAFGSLTAGCDADFVVLDRDVLDRPAAELLDAAVVATYVSGEEVFAQ